MVLNSAGLAGLLAEAEKLVAGAIVKANTDNAVSKTAVLQKDNAFNLYTTQLTSRHEMILCIIPF